MVLLLIWHRLNRGASRKLSVHPLQHLAVKLNWKILQVLQPRHREYSLLAFKNGGDQVRTSPQY